MNFPEEYIKKKNINKKSPFYRVSQIIGFLLGARFFMAGVLTFALYVSTFFLFNQDETFRNFVFDYKVHGIIFCTVLTILAGGIINQFYDLEKDHIIKPFRSRIQSFIKQKYFLYAYLSLGILSLGIAWVISRNVFFFFLIYQFFMWLYSHKLSRILLLNNLTFVSLTLYPFFGMMVYYETFSRKVFLMAVFLFLMLLCVDIIKDLLTKKADKIFGYKTLATEFSSKTLTINIVFILLLTTLVSMRLVIKSPISGFMYYYFSFGLFVLIACIYYIIQQTKRSNIIVLNILRVWLFLGIIAMLVNGLETKF